MYTVHQDSKKRRKTRSKKQNSGTVDMPRVCIFRSNKHIYVQVIDDKANSVIASASSLKSDLKNNKVQLSVEVGEMIGSKLLDLKIKNVVFDRNGYKYHGRVKAIAEAVRSKGISF